MRKNFRKRVEKKLLLFYNDYCQTIIQKKGVFYLLFNYIKNCYVNQDVKLNIVINNFSDEKGKQSQSSDSQPSYDDLAEEQEENINDFKQKFLPCKLDTLRLEQVYQYLERWNKSQSVHLCGTFLEFELDKGKTIDKKKLRKINSCKLRLCPYCSWRRSLRVFNNIRKCYDEIIKSDPIDNNFKSRFLLLTLTTRNCTLENLSDEVSLILSAFYKLSKYKEFKSAYLGFVRALEIVVDRERYITDEMYLSKKDYYDKRNLSVGDLNDNYLMCNVHIHVLLHTTYKIYQDNYLSQARLTELWQRALNIDYVPVVDIRSFRAKNVNTKGREIAEIAKYTVKPSDYICSEYVPNRYKKKLFDDCFLNDCKVIYFLDSALSSRRLLGLGGTFKVISSKLKLDNDKYIDDLEQAEAEKYILQYYFSFKFNKYFRIKDKKK